MAFTKNKLINCIITLFLCLQEPETDSHFGENHKNSPDIKGTTFTSKCCKLIKNLARPFLIAWGTFTVIKPVKLKHSQPLLCCTFSSQPHHCCTKARLQ